MDEDRLISMQAVVSSLQNTLGKMEIGLGSIDEAIINADKEGNIQWCNSAFDRLVGRTHLMVLGQNLFDILDLEIDYKKVSKDEHPVALLGQQSKLVRTNYGYKSSDGWLWLEISGNTIHVDDEDILIISIQDVTELKLSRDQLQRANIHLESRIQERTQKLREISNRYQAILDCAVDAIITIDAGGIIISLNPAVEKMFGYTNAEIIGKNIKIIIPEPHHSQHDNYLERFLETGKSKIIGIGRDVMGVRNDGKLVPLHLSLSEVDMEGQVLFTGILRDITQQTELISDLQEARKQADKASRSKSDFLARMSHELRTPLNAILGMADLLIESQLSEEQLKFVTVSRGSGAHLLNIIDDLLDISRIEAGKLVLENETIDLHELVDVVVTIGRTAADKKNLQVRSHISNEVPQYILGDSKRLRQILINLIGNSVKFTEKGSVDLHIIPQKSDINEDVLELLFQVKDTGIGILPEVQRDIFRSFAQAGPLINRKYGGTGLGLAISKNLVHMMGGQLDVQSSVGDGSTFFFTAQFDHVMDGDLTDHPQNKTYSTAASAKKFSDFPKKLSILLAEDSSDNRMLFGAYLKSFNCTLDEAENGAIAVSKYLKHSYDIILMDVQMPEMDGYSATRAIREHEKDNNLSNIPIIALTAHAQKSDTEASLKAGCTRHVVKPVTKKVLVENISALTDAGASETVTTAKVYIDSDIESLIPTFLDNRTTDIENLKNAIAHEDVAAIKKLGHILKGTGGGYGFDFITDIGRDIEIAGQQGDMDKTEKLTMQMEKMLDNLEIIFTD